MTDIAKLGLAVDATPVDKATTSLKNFKRTSTDVANQSVRNTTSIKNGFNSVTPAVNNTAKAAQAAAPKMSAFGNQARMVSLQLSQVAQQGSVTGNYFQALAIQLPDLMLGFGTLGILIGAVAGSLAGPLISALTGTSREIKAFNDLIDETKEGLQSVRLEVTTGAIDTLKDNIKSAAEEMERLQNIPDTMGGRALTNNRRLEIQAQRLEEINKLQKDQERNIEALAILEQRRSDIVSESSDTEAIETAAKRESDARIKALRDVESVLNSHKSPAERARDEMAEQKAILANAYSSDLVDFKEYKEAKKKIDEQYAAEKAEREKKDAIQNAQILTDSQAKSLGHTASFFGNLAAIAKEGGEEQFQRYKNLASAQAAISAALAVSSVLGDATVPTALRVPLAFSIGALAAVQVAQIQGQEYQGARAMGGQVQGGGRYLVGENGPEVLQLGSQGGNVTPNHALDGSAPPITNVFQISTGVAETAQAEIMKFVPYIQKVIKNTVIGESRKGGAMSRAVGAR